MSLILCSLDGPYDGYVVIERPQEVESAGDARAATKTEKGVVAGAQSQPDRGPRDAMAGRQAMIDAMEQVYCDAAILMEELDASRRAE